MAPEVLYAEEYDYHADTWSMGVVCYEMVKLRKPFHAQSLHELKGLVRRGTT